VENFTRVNARHGYETSSGHIEAWKKMMPRFPKDFYLGPKLFLAGLLMAFCLEVPAEEAPASTENQTTTGEAKAEDFDHQPSTDDLEYWSFRPMAKAEPETLVSGSEWVRTPVDAFILKKLTEKELTPSPPAEPRVWLRRVYMDVIGLPPTQEQVENFLKDSGIEARQRVVDQLLNDPGY